MGIRDLLYWIDINRYWNYVILYKVLVMGIGFLIYWNVCFGYFVFVILIYIFVFFVEFSYLCNWNISFGYMCFLIGVIVMGIEIYVNEFKKLIYYVLLKIYSFCMDEGICSYL